jgi:hypothetical protein
MTGSGTIAHAVSGAGFSVFYLPQGNYTVRVSLGNSTIVEKVLSETGSSSVLSAYFTTSPDREGLYLLLATAGIGSVASAVVWVKVYRDRR